MKYGRSYFRQHRHRTAGLIVCLVLLAAAVFDGGLYAWASRAASERVVVKLPVLTTAGQTIAEAIALRR